MSRVLAPSVARLSYWIADLKFTPPGRAKILEFGLGFRSGFKGYRQLHGTSMHSLFWRYTSEEMGLRGWYAPHPRALAHLGSQKLRELHALGTLEERGGVVRPIEHLPSRYELFLDPLKQWDPADLSTYSGLLVYQHRLGGLSPWEVEALVGRSPGFIRLDAGGAIAATVENKFWTRVLLGDNGEATPRWRLLFKENAIRQIPRILRELPSDRYVLKPIDQTLGIGVVVVRSENLRSAFERLFKNGGWRADTAPTFLLETYEPSLPLAVGEKVYDPTLRMAFILWRSRGATQIQFLDGYWKLPPYSLGWEGLRGKTVSRVGHRSNASAVVAPEVKAAVMAQLGEILPPFFERLTDITPREALRVFLDGSPEEREAGIYSARNGHIFTPEERQDFESLLKPVKPSGKKGRRSRR